MHTDLRLSLAKSDMYLQFYSGSGTQQLRLGTASTQQAELQVVA